MKRRNGNRVNAQGQKAQARLGLAKLLEHFKAALVKCRCPECGSPLVREGNALVCLERECGGVGAAQFRIKCYRAMARGEALS